MADLFERLSIRRNRARAFQKFNDHGFLFDLAAQRLLERLGDIRRNFPLALQIGARGPVLEPDTVNHFFISDCLPLHNQLPPHLTSPRRGEVPHRDSLPPPRGGLRRGERFCADEDFLPIKDNSLDLIVSNLCLHTVNDLPGALIQIRRALKPDGLFLASMLGGESLYQLRAALTQAEMKLRGGISPRVHPFADKQQMGALMQRAGFALPVVDSEFIDVTYSTLAKLLHDLRYMGEGNALASRNKAYAGREFFRTAEHLYQRDSDNLLSARFEIVYIIGWAPHDSQQKPLRPGSAKSRLADALGAQEIKMS